MAMRYNCYARKACGKFLLVPVNLTVQAVEKEFIATIESGRFTLGEVCARTQGGIFHTRQHSAKDILRKR